MRRRKEKETISFLIEVLDKMAKNGVIRDDIIEETYWTLKKLLKDRVDESVLQAFEDIVILRTKAINESINAERYLESAKNSLLKVLEGSK